MSAAGIVIAGGGLAAQRAAESLRRAGHTGRLQMLCGEPHRPYDRPPLSKAVLEQPGHEIPYLRAADWYEKHGVELLLGRPAARLDAGRRELILRGGDGLHYDSLLIATGSRPRSLKQLEGRDNVSTLRTFEDAAGLRSAIERGARIAIVGAGFVGLEVAATARRAGCEVTLIEAAELPLAHILGTRIGRWFAALHEDEGVRAEFGTGVAAAIGSPHVHAIQLADGRRIQCDHVLVGIGVQADCAWAGFPATGIPIDDAGRTELPHVFAAGDVAAPLHPVLGRHVAGGHWELAVKQAARAARTMLGGDLPAMAAPSFWSDQYGVRIQHLGHSAHADSMLIDGDLAARDFMALYSHRGTPVAALLVGRPHALPEARNLIAGGFA